MNGTDFAWPVGLTALGLATSWFTWRQLARLRLVWRGGTIATLPWNSGRGPEVNHRSFPVFTASCVCCSLFLVGLAINIDTGNDPDSWLGRVGVAFFAAFLFVLFPLWVVVNATNHPSILVPPPRRTEPGWVQSANRRRKRRVAGQAPTEHAVEILEVRPLPGASDQHEPYFLAVCQQGCSWQEGPLSRDAEHPDPDAWLRATAARHTTTLIGPTRRTMG